MNSHKTNHYLSYLFEKKIDTNLIVINDSGLSSNKSSTKTEKLKIVFSKLSL